MNPKPKRTTRSPGELAALVTALAVSKRRVNQLLAEGMPATPAAAVAWRDKIDSGDASAKALRQERLLLVRAQRLRLEQETKVRAGELVSLAAVGDAFQAIGAATKHGIQKLEGELPQLLEGMTPAQMARIIREKGDEILNAIADYEAKVGTSS